MTSYLLNGGERPKLQVEESISENLKEEINEMTYLSNWVKN